jgi:Effector-associated domain 11
MTMIKIKQLIAQNRLNEAIETLLIATENTHWHNQMVLVSTRFNEYQKLQRQGGIEPETLNRLRNQIADTLLSIHEDVSKTFPPSVLRRFWESIRYERLIRYGLFISLASLVYLGIMYLFQNRMINVSVFVEDKNRELVLKQQGHILMEVGTEYKKELIDDKGVASFKNIKIGEKVGLKVDFSEPYRPLNEDTIYTIQSNGQIHLTVGLKYLDYVFGNISYEEQPLSDVSVNIGTLQAITDKYGRYEFHIPENLQQKEQEVRFSKTGFKMQVKKAFPQFKEPLNIVMENK